MRWIDKLFGRERADRDLEDELSFHIDMQARTNRDAGMTDDEARAAALRAMGGREHRAEECREVRRTRFLEDLLQDATYAIRTLQRNPGFALVAVLSLAGGIGATAIAASALYGILLKPLPFHDPDRLVVLWQTRAQEGWKRYEVAPGNYLDWKREARAFTELAALNPYASATLTGHGEPERIEGARVSANYFRVLGTQARLGRTFTDGEDTEGRERVAVISYNLWHRRFGADPSVVGRSVTFDSRQHTIIGVLPETFAVRAATPDLETSVRDVQVWRPLVFAPNQQPNREHGSFRVIGRLSPNASLALAHTDMESVARRQAEAHPGTNRGWSVQIVPLHEQTSGDLSRTILIAAGAVGLALALACVSVAGLMLARSAGRTGELAMRMALGASRMRLTRQILTESLVLALTGGIAGVLLARVGLPLLLRQDFISLPRKEEITLNLHVLAFVLFITIAAGLMFGLAPALRVGALAERTRTATATRSRLRFADLLIGTQVAISCLLVVGSGLLMLTLSRLHAVDPGFDYRGLLVFQVTLPGQVYNQPASRVAFFRAVEQRVRALPGVRSASSSTSLPFMLRSDQAVIPYRLPGDVHNTHDMASANAVQPSYFETMGIQRQEGRAFHERDDRQSRLAMVVNDELARRAWPGRSAIGQKISIEQDSAGQRLWRDVVGVVRTVRPFGLDSPPQPAFYIPLAQFEVGWQLFAVRVNGDPASLAPAIRREVASLDPRQPIHNVDTMESMVGRSLATRRAVFVLVGGLALLAAILAAIGLDGLLAYRVRQARREIGIRMALGSSVWNVLTLVLRRGLVTALSGCAAGLACAAISGRILGSLLFEVTPLEPVVYAATALAMCVVALVACAAPAWRAVAVNPAETLSAE